MPAARLRLTSAEVDWWPFHTQIEPTEAPVNPHQSPNLAPLLQEVVQQSGTARRGGAWRSGNALSIVIADATGQGGLIAALRSQVAALLQEHPELRLPSPPISSSSARIACTLAS